MSNFTLKKTTRKNSKIKIGLSAPSGSGKTYSALRLAYGLTGDWDKIGIIDTENGTAANYAPNFNTKFNVINLEAPFSPERYIEAIRTCELAGMEVIIIDSITQEWEGTGGCLEINETIAKAKFKGNTWTAWSETTPRHQKFINAIIYSPCHIITTVRNKIDMAQVEGKIKKVGVKEVTREGFEYELSINLNIDRETHLAMVSKDRTNLFGDSDPFLITEETGKKIKEWCENGAVNYELLIKTANSDTEINSLIAEINLKTEGQEQSSLKQLIQKRAYELGLIFDQVSKTFANPAN